MQEYFTVSEVAEIKKVSSETVRRWLRNGKIQGQRLGGTKSGWRIHRKDIYPGEANVEDRLAALIKDMTDNQAMFDTLAQDVQSLLKKTTHQTLPEEIPPLTHITSKNPGLTAELWQSRLPEHTEELDEICHLLKLSYEKIDISKRTYSS